jgi:hypothetical protein
MLTTHSPYFINPLEDHTTIVRIERDGERATPRTFRAEAAAFSPNEKENLRALLQLDTSLCEMFFGSYPVLVEGDTEHAIFIASVLEEGDALGEKVTVVRARGKALIEPLIKLLAHFGVPFGVLHDSDSPWRKDGARNGAWTENEKIIAAVKNARDKGVHVQHRISIPDVERLMGGDEESKDKPLNAYKKVRGDLDLRGQVQKLFKELHDHADIDPFPPDDIKANNGSVFETLLAKVSAWAQANAPGDNRFAKPEETS